MNRDVNVSERLRVMTVSTFFNRSRLRVRRGESMREVCDRLGVVTQVLGLAEGAVVPLWGGAARL